MAKRKDVQSEDGVLAFRLDLMWWVVFEDRDENVRRWWDIFTKPRFRHCWAFAERTFGGEEGYISINCGVGGTQISWSPMAELNKSGFRDMLDFCLYHKKIVVPAFGTITNDYIHRFSPLTCVTQVKHLLGLRCSVLSPFQLYKYLVNHNLDVVNYKEVLKRIGV